MTRTAAVIVAAGSGARFGGAKQFAPLGGRPLVDWSCEAFQTHPRIDDIVLVLPETSAKPEYIRRFPKILDVVSGGARRQDSVWAGVKRLDAHQTGFVLIHDGARPLVPAEVIDRVLTAAKNYGGAVPVIFSEDTLKEIDADRIVRTLDRDGIGRVQTPQGFAHDLLRRALVEAFDAGFSGPDEASLVERLGETVAVVLGDPRNIKITTPLDLITAEAIRHENRPGI
ncbi:MAG: 2-C-methyl-D-erythritol 4-phosphate cytidylyltransferase [Candidatus Aminicenantes bacterium]|nr:2-C-methyl-D-erythritol 4-phosphate cytidylyltransferase [Candidatus Aminicenantes bacterium]